MAKIGVYAAHDDDVILGAGGRIIQHLKNGDKVYVVIFSDGRDSHKSVLGIEKNPTPWEVKRKRREEIKKAMEVLGVEKNYFLKLKKGRGKVRENVKEAERQVKEITKKEKPNLIYFHYPDAHPDHRAVNLIVKRLIRSLNPKPEGLQFCIWNKDLAKNRPEVNADHASKIKGRILEFNIQKELEIKRKAIFAMKSQVSIHPYPNWQVQPKPILGKKFINHFLKKKEIFIKFEK